MASNDAVIENQFFIGVPWKSIRPKFETVISELEKEYPIHCVIFGKNTGQDANDLWHSIQQEIRVSAATIFDVTGSNPNVALEFGYAEALGKRRVLTRNERKPRMSAAATHSGSIMSDLAGKVRVPYKNNQALKRALAKEFDRNQYVVRFKAFLKNMKRRKFGQRHKKVAIATVQELAGGKRVKKPNLLLNLGTCFPGVTTVDIPDLIDTMTSAKLLVIKTGPNGGVSIPTVN